MDSSTYMIMMSAQKLLDNQEILANNLANASTIGFKSELINKTVLSDNNNTKNFSYSLGKKYDKTLGSFRNTEQPLDIAIKHQNGWLVVKTNTNDTAYTKNGHLQINSKGQLTSQDNIVMGQNGPIIIPKHSNIKILSDGTIKITENNKKFDKKLDKLQLVRINFKDLTHSDYGLYFLNKTNKSNIVIKHDPNVKISSETLEDSNVNLSEDMINIIYDARIFEMQIKLLSNFNENMQLINKFLNINN